MINYLWQISTIFFFKCDWKWRWQNSCERNHGLWPNDRFFYTNEAIVTNYYIKINYHRVHILSQHPMKFFFSNEASFFTMKNDAHLSLFNIKKESPFPTAFFGPFGWKKQWRKQYLDVRFRCPPEVISFVLKLLLSVSTIVENFKGYLLVHKKMWSDPFLNR